MKVKLESTSNSSMKPLEGLEGQINIGLSLSFRFKPLETLPFEFRKGYIRTSIIKEYSSKEISFNCFRLTFHTNNSEYVFIYGEFDKNKPSLSEEEKLLLSMNFLF